MSKIIVSAAIRGAHKVVKNAAQKLDDSLSSREMEVLMFVGKGMTNKDIAGHLSISSHTVANHLRHIYEKLHVRSRTEAILKALPK